MLTNLFKQSTRSFKRQRSYVIINITGLSLGIACSLLIALYIFNEASYDRYNENKDRIYNIATNFLVGGEESTDAMSPYIIGPTMLREIPEVEDFLRMKRYYGANTVIYNNQEFSEEYIIEADSSFFSFFTIPVLAGNKSELLNAPGKVVLSASLARKIFGSTNPVDKVLRLGKDTVSYIVSGVMDDVPGNSHFRAGMLISMMSDPRVDEQEWGNNTLNTYVLLKPNADYKSVEEKMKPFVVSQIGPLLQQVLKISFEEFLEKGNKYGYYLQKLTDIHLDNSIKPHFLATGDPKLLKILGGIALLILLVATVNFTNLSTAQAGKRSKEVAVRKLTGSGRGILIIQFLAESVLMSVIATVIALIIIKIVLPFFNDLLGTSLSLNLSATPYVIPFLILFPVLTGILAGSYPAFYLSSFNPNSILKGGKVNSNHRGSLRKILVVLQFSISVFLIVGTLIMYRQIIYMLNRYPGFNKEQLLAIENERVLGQNARSFKESLTGIPGVMSIAGSNYIPGNIRSNQGYALEGRKDETILLWTISVDYDFLGTYDMELMSGRFFSRAFPSDYEACLVNEAAIKKFNIDPENMRIIGYSDAGPTYYYPIIGVVKDFVFESQKNQIEPLIIRLRHENERYGYITVRMSQLNYMSTIKQIENTWSEFVKDEPIKYTFLDDIMNQLYIRERQNASIAVISAVLAILIASLGLYGLTSYSVEHRIKEIGVRKVMGSSVAGISYLISKDTLILVTISALVSFPVILYASRKWLENFYYRINPGIITFLGGLVIALLIAFLTISYRTVKAARANPAKSLRYE